MEDGDCALGEIGKREKHIFKYEMLLCIKNILMYACSVLIQKFTFHENCLFVHPFDPHRRH